MEISLIECPGDKEWMEVKKRALVTVGKVPIEPPNIEWKKKILRAKHSPIRYLRFSFRLENIPYFASVHLCRHVHTQPYVKSQRNDRQSNYDRNLAPQNSPVNMIWDMNAESLLSVSQKRLCHQADPMTRHIVSVMCDLVLEKCPEFEGLLVPPCELYGSCFEMKPCGKVPSTASWILDEENFFTPIDICSNCGYAKPVLSGENVNQPPKNYCPNCGKRMI